jgi:multidrug efflux pump
MKAIQGISDVFIQRPVATTLLTLAVIFAGVLGFGLLPVAPLPQVDIPTISVNAALPGASPETMAATVATPLERALGRIAGVSEMTSGSSLGSTHVTLQFDVSRDIDGAARDVQAAINASRSTLPSSLPGNPTYKKVNPANAPIMILGLTSDVLSPGQMYDTAQSVLAQRILQLQGVGDVTIGGGALPAVRVELDPNAVAHQNVALSSIATAIANANVAKPKGAIEAGGQHWQVDASDQASKAADYMPLIVGYHNGAAVRLKDIADVQDSVENVRNAGRADAKPAILLIITQAPNANIIETIQHIRDELPLLRSLIPTAIKMKVVMDRSPTIRASLRDVERSLVLAVGLVILAVYLFLRRARATLVPSVAVPVSLIGTFGVMYLLGFSLNNLSLMALTIATGFVVDDAIVVLENIARHVEEGMAPMEAAFKGAREVGFTVLSMSISLVAVFIPFLFMGDVIGRMFREFAVTLTVDIIISLVVSLTTTPMMCSRLLRSDEEEQGKEGWVIRKFGALLEATQRGYLSSLKWALGHSRLMIMTLVAALVLNVYLFVALPKGLFPEQDTGRVMGFITGDQAISFQAMRDKLDDFMRIVISDPAVDTVAGFTGGGDTNSGRMFITLKPLSERKVSMKDLVDRLRKKLDKEPGAKLFLNPMQDVRTGGRPSNATYQYTLQSDDLNALRVWAPKLEDALIKQPELADVNSDQEDQGLETALVYDRDTMARLGLTASNVDNALYAAFGQRQVSTIYRPLNQYHVIVEAAPQFTQSPETLQKLFVVNPAGQSIPLSAFAHWAPGNAPLSVNHQGQFAAATISFNLPKKMSLSDADRIIERTRVTIGMPTTVQGSFQGTAKTYKDNQNSQLILIIAAIVAVYIVLGILYESYIHPITILSTLPSAGLGALLALWVTNTEFSQVALIGILLLIGIVKKNAIMLIDFALDAERREGLSTHDAILKACGLRFRPIMMTTFAAIFGAVPLALGHGDGAELRQPLGIAIVGGLVMSQLMTLYTTPVIYLYLDRFSLWCGRLWSGRQHAAEMETP